MSCTVMQGLSSLFALIAMAMPETPRIAAREEGTALVSLGRNWMTIMVSATRPSMMKELGLPVEVVHEAVVAEFFEAFELRQTDDDGQAR